MGEYWVDTPNTDLACWSLLRPECGLVPAGCPAQGEAQIPAELALCRAPASQCLPLPCGGQKPPTEAPPASLQCLCESQLRSESTSAQQNLFFSEWHLSFWSFGAQIQCSPRQNFRKTQKSKREKHQLQCHN